MITSELESHFQQPAWSRVRAILLLRLTLAIATSYLLWAHQPAVLVSGATPWLILAGFLSNVVIYRLPSKVVASAQFSALLVVADTLWVTATLLVSGQLRADFFLIYFFVLFLAAISENLVLMTVGTAMVSLAYLYLVYATEGREAFTSASLIRVPFFFAVAALYGFFADRVRRERLRSSQLLVTAHTDALTELPNRRGLEQLLDDAIARSLRTGRELAVLLIDLDHFKYINDSYGHLVGDDTLLAIASRLRDQVRRIDGFGRMADGPSSEPTGRLGGDEFGLILTEIAHLDQVVHVAQRICDVASQPILLEDLEVRTTVSIGISIFPPRHGEPVDPRTADVVATCRQQLLSEADRALYSAKAAGRNTFAFHDPGMDQEANTRIKLANGLRYALDRGEFYLAYQPQVDLATMSIIGVEALLRWQRAEGEEPVGPDEFIPVAESTGQIRAIGEWVLERACSDATNWREITGLAVPVAVNISAIQFRSPGLLESVGAILESVRLPSELLELELTESVLLRSTPTVRETMLKLHDNLGVALSLDDVGRGFSSLEYLCKMPFDKIKVDRFFVTSSDSEASSRAVVSAIIALGLKLGLKVAAEGVETEAQLAFLRGECCDFGQGYLFSEPIAGPELERFFKAHGRRLTTEHWCRLAS